MKKCYKCKKKLDWEQFSKDRSKFDGLSSRCKPCDREAVQAREATEVGKVNIGTMIENTVER